MCFIRSVCFVGVLACRIGSAFGRPAAVSWTEWTKTRTRRSDKSRSRFRHKMFRCGQASCLVVCQLVTKHRSGSEFVSGTGPKDLGNTHLTRSDNINARKKHISFNYCQSWTLGVWTAVVNWSRSKEANEWCFLGHAFLDVQDAVSNKKTQESPMAKPRPSKDWQKSF